MDVKFTDAENAFRLEVREFFRSAMPEDVRELLRPATAPSPSLQMRAPKE